MCTNASPWMRGIFIGARRLDEGDVDGHELPAKERRDLRQKDGRVVRQPFVDRLARAVADEERVVPEVGLELLVRVGRDTQRPDVEHLGIEERLGVRLHEVDHRAHEVLGLSARRADEDPVAPVDAGEDLVFRDEFLWIPLAEALEDLLGQLLIHVLPPYFSVGPNPCRESPCSDACQLYMVALSVPEVNANGRTRG